MPNPFQENNQQETQDLSDFGNQFLNGVDESDREIVSKYIKDWDGNVTRKFQEYSGKLKDYEELGDVSQLTSAHELLGQIQEDPVEFFNYFKDYLLENAQTIQEQYGIEDINQALGLAMQQEEDRQNSLPEYDGLPESFVSEWQEMKNFISEFGEDYQSTKASLEEKENAKMLDSALDDLHNEHGDFDDRVVIAYIASGMTPEDAVGAFQELKESLISSQNEPPPNLMSGPAATPLDQVDRAKLNDPAARKAIGASILSSLQQRS